MKSNYFLRDWKHLSAREKTKILNRRIDDYNTIKEKQSRLIETAEDRIIASERKRGALYLKKRLQIEIAETINQRLSYLTTFANEALNLCSNLLQHHRIYLGEQNTNLIKELSDFYSLELQYLNNETKSIQRKILTLRHQEKLARNAKQKRSTPLEKRVRSRRKVG